MIGRILKEPLGTGRILQGRMQGGGWGGGEYKLRGGWGVGRGWGGQVQAKRGGVLGGRGGIPLVELKIPRGPFHGH